MSKPATLNKLAFALLCLALFAAAVPAQSTGGVKGKVRTTKGSGIGGATVTARKKGLDVKTTKANSSGEFVLDGLETGRYNVVFEAPGFSSGVLYNVEINKNKTSDLGDRLILTLDQGNQIILKGSVFDKQGFSVPGAKIEISSVGSDGSKRSLGNTYTDVSGEFTFRPKTEAAKLRITANYKGISASQEIDVDNPAIYRLAISLDLPPRTSN
jgi:hypothetical protein